MKWGSLAGAPQRGLILLILVTALLAAVPLFAGGYLVSVLIVALYFAYTGQAWNILMGFAGQLSLGHALYVGLGAYTAAALFTKYGLPPWLGFVPAVLVTMAFGTVIGFLAFRFSIGGVYFALLTIAFAEFTRIAFDHFAWVGAAGGLFLPVAQRGHDDLLRLRGSPAMFYYVILAATASLFALCAALLRSRIGYYWLAIRENQDAAESLGIPVFRYKMLAVVLSSALTAFSGVFFAFYYNNLFPEQIFNIGTSIEIIVGPIVGGLGTLAGPILGAFVLQALAEGITNATIVLGIEVPGIKQVFYGGTLFAIIMFLPHGIWPWLRVRLGIKTSVAR
jgi:branched-chain amino acid transport system permease protein